MNKEYKEIILSNISELSNTIDTIKENFNKEEKDRSSIIVKFDNNISEDDFIKCLQELFEFEITSKFTIDILIKNLSYNHRKKALSCALKTPELRNPIFLMNIFCLIKGYNTFEEAYFEHEQVFLNDEVEFLDIFDDLEEEIKEVTLKTAEYYISMLKTCNLVEAVENNPNAVKMENIYIYLFNSMDVTILARILSQVKDPSIWETKKIVLNSLGYLGKIAEKFVFANTIMSLIGQTIMEKAVKDSLESKLTEE